MRVEEIDVGTVSALSLRTTESALERMRGLLGRPALRVGEALVIRPCNMIHTIGMTYPIDVVFVGSDGVIRKRCSAVAPRRARMCLNARCVVETRAGEAARRGWHVGVRLDFLADNRADR